MKSRLIALCGSLAAACATQAGYTPVAIQSSSYNADVIVEQNATPSLPVVTSASIDNGTNNTANTLFEVGYDVNNPQNGVPVHGSILTSYDNPNFTFQMPPTYVGPSGILIGSDITNGTFNLTDPQAYTVLSVLGLGGNGGNGINIIVHHQDGTTETKASATADWFGGTVGIAAIMGGRLNSTVNLTTETDGTSGDGLGNPRIYHREVTLTNTTSPVTSVEIQYSSGSGHSDVMALSGGASTNKVSPIAVTGYDYDFVCEATAPHDGRILSQTIVDDTNVWATTQSMDSDTDTGTSWYEQGFNVNNGASGDWNNVNQSFAGTGLPHPSSFVTNSTGDHIYQMPSSYTTNDAIYISDTVTNDTITLTTPAAYTALSFLGSAGSGPVVVNYIVNHTGGTQEKGTLSVPDWFSAGGYVFTPNGRVAVDTAQFSSVVNDNNAADRVLSGDPEVFANDITLTDTTDPVTSIVLYNTNSSISAAPSGRFSLFALSGTAGVVPPIINAQPVSTNQYADTVVTLSVGATANAALSYQWQIQSNGVWANLNNGGNISGATSANLTFNTLQFADQANFQVVVTDAGGSLASGTATVNVFSTESDVTQPGDSITGVNISPFGDGSPSYAIDNTMDTKFGANINGGEIAGLVVTPSVGLTVVNALRIYTGADSTGRDPTSFEILGSLNGGASYTLISSNAIALSNNRNPLVAEAPDPLTQYVTEVRFPNTTGYTTYELLFPTLKGSGQVQFQEMELLGTNDTAALYFNTQPTNANVYEGTSASFSAFATATPTPTVAWYRGANGVYSALNNAGNISGAKTSTLTVNPAHFSDALDYIAIATSGSTTVTSAVAHLYVYTTATNVVQPNDSVSEFGDTTGTRYGNASPTFAIDGTTTDWENGGSGFSAGAGFPPFGGPVGIIVTPTIGSTVLSGVRFYTGQDPAVNDPANYVLSGSNTDTNDGSFTTIASGSLSLPLARGIIDMNDDPTMDPVQEILFNNSSAYKIYKVTFNDIRSDSTGAYLSIGDIQFLGTPASAAPLSVGGISLSGGNLTITGGGGTPGGSFEVLTNGNIAAPLSTWGTNISGTFDSNGNLSVQLPVSESHSGLFFVIKTQ